MIPTAIRRSKRRSARLSTWHRSGRDGATTAKFQFRRPAPLQCRRSHPLISDVPFADELFSRHVEVVPYRAEWAHEGAQLVAQLRDRLPDAQSIVHIGSTSVPGLPAKDCLDVMVQVRDLAECDVARTLKSAGYRRRPESWNSEEISYAVTHQKLVFAQPSDGRTTRVGSQRSRLMWVQHRQEWALRGGAHGRRQLMPVRRSLAARSVGICHSRSVG